jgi:hypothetical protein
MNQWQLDQVPFAQLQLFVLLIERLLDLVFVLPTYLAACLQGERQDNQVLLLPLE